MKSIKEIADICGYSKTSVNRTIKELGIVTEISGNKNMVSDADADRIVSVLCGFGKTCEEIKPNQAETETKSKQTETESKTSVLPDNVSNNDFLVNFLIEQIKVKDSQIENLQNENQLLIQAQAYTLKQIEELKRIDVKPAEIVPETTEENQEAAATTKKKRWFPFALRKE